MKELLMDYRVWTAVLVVAALAGCGWLAETLPPEVAQPILEAGEQAAEVAATVAEDAEAAAVEIASKAEDPVTGLAGWATVILVGAAATLLRKAQKSAQDALKDTEEALEKVTKKIQEKDTDGVIRAAVSKTMLHASAGANAALEKARP